MINIRNTEDVTAVHVHCAPEGENGPIGVTLFEGDPTNRRAYSGTIRAPDLGNACGWDNLDTLVMALRSGDTYVNVHTVEHPSGEIRGQIETIERLW